MATEKGSSPSLIRRPVVLAAGSAGATATVLGVLAAAPVAIQDLGSFAAAVTSTGEGISAVVGTGLGLAATGIIAAVDRTHWVSQSTSDCGVLDGTTRQHNDEYSTVTQNHCVHDGEARRTLLKTIGVPALVIGVAAAVVGGAASAIGFEHDAASIAMDIGTAVATAGGIAGAASLVRNRHRAGLGE